MRVAILMFAHATVVGIVIGIAFLGLAVFLHRRPLVHRLGLDHWYFQSAARFLGVCHRQPGSGLEGSGSSMALCRVELYLRTPEGPHRLEFVRRTSSGWLPPRQSRRAC